MLWWNLSNHLVPDRRIFLRAGGQLTERTPYTELQPPLREFHRQMFLSDNLLADFFRVTGGSRHEYVYHGAARIQSISMGEMQDYVPTQQDNQLLQRAQNLKIAQVQGIYSIEFAQGENQPFRERIWFVDAAGSQLLTGSFDSHDFLIIRRQEMNGGADHFVVVHEWISDPETVRTQVERLVIDPAPNERDYQVVGLAVTQVGTTDIFLSATRPDISYSTKYRGGHLIFEGIYGHVQLKNNQLSQLQLIGGRQLRYDVHGVEFKPGNPGAGLIQDVAQESSTILTDFVHMIPQGEVLKGHSVLVMPQQPQAVNYQTHILESVHAEEPPQQIRLFHHPNLRDPVSRLAAPVRVGDTVFLEPHVDLRRLDEDNFTVYATVPAEVLIEGALNRNRVLYQSGVLDRIRGQSKAGVIIFNIDPAEATKEPVPFSRIP